MIFILYLFSANFCSYADWNVSMNSFSCSGQNPQQTQETPKLENFLGVGGHSFTDNQEQNNLQDGCNPIRQATDHQSNGRVNSYNIYQEAEAISHTNNTGGLIMNGNSNMGLSMIKNWLRNHQAPPHAADDKVDNEVAAPLGPVAGAQTLSLSMSTGSKSSDNKLQQCGTAVDSQNSGGAIESVPRKSLDTFGQRTSIYRGVTRFSIFYFTYFLNKILWARRETVKKCNFSFHFTS